MKGPFIILICTVLFFSSCSEYQKALRSDDIGRKYAAADSLYQIGKYRKALKLFEQIVPSYRGKPQSERIMFMYANTFYNLGDYVLAGYQFERFETSYPKSDSVEVAAYRSAKSYYELSPRYSLDQADTYKALDKLQAYINEYPTTEYRDEANNLVKELREKLERKDFEIANQLLRISDYKPAIAAFENFISDHPGSKYRADAFYKRFEAAYKLAINSIPTLVEERLLTSKEYYQSFKKYYKDTELDVEAQKIMEDVYARLTVTETETTP